MAMAFDEAKKGLGFTSPNPCVGAVIVKGGMPVARGYHRRAGGKHAEIEALEDLGVSAEGLEMYVTLEPCAHQGKTGPCADALIEAGIRKVFIGMLDPFSEVDGRGVEKLRTAGVEVELLNEQEPLYRKIRALNQPFLKCHQLSLPYVVLKAGMSLDGRIATASGVSQWITGAAARDDGRLERSRCDAVLLGANTVKMDDPELAAAGIYEGKNLLRVIVGNKPDLDPEMKVFRDPNVLYACGEVEEADIDKYAEHGVELIHNFGTDASGIRKFFTLLAERGVQSIYIEGGSSAAGYLYDAFLEDSELLDKVIYYVAPKIIGGREALAVVGGTGLKDLQNCPELMDFSCESCAEDLKLSGVFNFY